MPEFDPKRAAFGGFLLTNKKITAALIYNKVLFGQYHGWHVE